METKPNLKMKTKPNLNIETNPNLKIETELNRKIETKQNPKIESEPNLKTETKPNLKLETRPNLKMETKPNQVYLGGKACVWNISGGEGQQIEVTLLDTSLREVFQKTGPNILFGLSGYFSYRHLKV